MTTFVLAIKAERCHRFFAGFLRERSGERRPLWCASAKTAKQFDLVVAESWRRHLNDDRVHVMQSPVAYPTKEAK